MSPEHVFLAAIKESPLDDRLRLIFADWLEENGQPERAEFIRVQIELATLDDDKQPRYRALWARQLELLSRYQEHWLPGCRTVGWLPRLRMGWRTRFYRGLIEFNCKVEELPGELAAAGGDAVLPWIGRVAVQGEWAAIYAALQEPWMQHVPYLDLRSARIGDAGAARLAACDHVAHLAALNLSQTEIGDDGAVALAASPRLERLTALRLGANRIGAKGLLAVASSPHLSRLNSLCLGATGTYDPVVTALAALPQIIRIKDLRLWNGSFGDVGASALAASPYVAGLTRLDLNGNSIGAAGAAALAASPHLAGLTYLNLSFNRIADKGARALAVSPYLAPLRYLGVRHSGGIRKRVMARLYQRFGGAVDPPVDPVSPIATGTE